MILYHGAMEEIVRPDIRYSRDKVDFGKGFYLTDKKPQAASWALRFKKVGLPCVVNVYELPFEQVKKEFLIKEFKEYNREWLEFVLANRQGRQQECIYDLITGGIADDKVFTTIGKRGVVE